MTSTTRPIAELVEERQRIAAQVASLNKTLESLDSELFARLDTALTALGLTAPVAAVAETRPPLPPPLAPVSPAFLPPVAPSQHAISQIPVAPNPLPPKTTEKGWAIQKGTAEVLRAFGRPIKIKDLYDRLVERGVDIPGKNPQNNLSAHLSRSDQFVCLREGWWFREKQTPPEGGA